MAYVIPFRGLRYNPEKFPDLSRVVSPPYDIIPPDKQQHYYDKDIHNAIRVDFGPVKPGDNTQDNRYTRAAAALKDWVDDRALVPEAKPAIYLLREEFEGPEGEPAVRDGFIAAVRLTEFSEGIILPHEETASGPKEDRLRLMEATAANLSPIFCLYSDPEMRIKDALSAALSRKPDASLTDEAGTRHSLRIIDDEHIFSRITAALADKQLLIADGHHRYETALAYRNARRAAGENGKSDHAFNYMMIYLSDMEDSSGSILPIHRLVSGLDSETIVHVKDLLEPHFVLEEVAATEPEPGRKMMNRVTAAVTERNAYGLYLPSNNSYYVLVARGPRPLLGSTGSIAGRSAAWRSLEVSALDHLVLKNLLGVCPEGPNSAARVDYVERTSNALRRAAGYDAAFFVNPASMDEIKAVAEAGEKMPQKSTYFHPKPLTGLVFRSFKY